MRLRMLLVAALLTLTCLPAAAEWGDRGDLELGLFAGFAWPDDFGREPTAANPDDGALIGARAGLFFSPRWSLELSAQHLDSDTAFAPAAALTDGSFSVTSIRSSLLYNFRPTSRVRPYLAAGFGVELIDVENVFDDDDASYQGGGGVRWYLGERFALRFDGRWVATDVEFYRDVEDTVEATIGASWTFSSGAPADSDLDGVVDRRERCPDTPRGAVVDDRGCPVDMDADGVPDGIDRCPGTSTGITVDNRGCEPDSDADGVLDGADRCPATPRQAVVDSSGCAMDTDGDGVPDGLDACPRSVAGSQVDARGCATDADGDGVADGVDRCPGTPAGTRVDAGGCPADGDGDGVADQADLCPATPAGVEVDPRGCRALFQSGQRTLVLEGVTFETGSATLTPRARQTLDGVASALAGWPDERLEVAGHTDSVGDAAFNQRLSAQRAASVLAYLVEKGVSASRLAPRGYGESEPVDDNATPTGRYRNRRVELRRLGGQ